MQQDLITTLAKALTGVDPSNPEQLAEAQRLAGAVLSTAMAFVREQHGPEQAAQVVGEIFDAASRAVATGVAPQATAMALDAEPRRDGPASIQGMAEPMLAYLNGRPPADADAEARASIWAAAAFLRGRNGEPDAVAYLKAIQAKMSMLAWFEQLPVESQTRH